MMNISNLKKPSPKNKASVDRRKTMDALAKRVEDKFKHPVRYVRRKVRGKMMRIPVYATGAALGSIAEAYKSVWTNYGHGSDD